MYLEFMKPTVWDMLVIAITVIGLVLAGLQIARNRAAYKRQQQRDDTNSQRRRQ